MSIKFKQYDAKDDCYQHAWKLRQQVLRAPLDLSLTQQDRENDLLCWHFGLFEDEKLIATVTVEFMARNKSSMQQVKLRQMVVLPHYQGQGLGQQLIKKTEQQLRQKSVSEIFLAARLPAVGFYQKLGFIVQGDVYHHLRIDHQDMRKSLS